MKLQNNPLSPKNPSTGTEMTPADTVAKKVSIQTIVKEPDTKAEIGVSKALAWKARNPSYSMEIDELLKITQNDAHLKLFLKTAERLITSRNVFVEDLLSGMSRIITTNPTDTQLELFFNAAERLTRSIKGLYVNHLAIGMNKVITANPTDTQLELFLNAAESLINSGKEDSIDKLATGMNKLISAKPTDPQWELFKNTAESLIKSEKASYVSDLAIGMSELITRKLSDPQWELFKNTAESLISSGKADSINSLVGGMDILITAKPSNDLLKLFLNTAESLTNSRKGSCINSLAIGMGGLIDTNPNDDLLKLFLNTAENLTNSGKANSIGDLASGMRELITANISDNAIKKTIEIYNLIQELNDLPDLDHEERKVKLPFWYSDNAFAIANLEIISPEVHNFVINSFLTQRKNPAHYTSEISVCSELSSNTVQNLKDFYNSNKLLFNSDQLFLLRIISYVNACDKLGINVFEDSELKNHTSTQKDLTRFLGNKLFTKFAEDLKIEIPKDYDVDKFLESWDLRNLGALLNTKKSWSEDDTKLFKLLIESKLKNIESGVLTPNKEGLPELSEYGSTENQDLVRSLRKSHDKFLTEMTELHLDGKKWINAHTEIQETSNASEAKEKGTKQLLKEFKTRFATFTNYVKNNNLVSGNKINTWEKITQSEIIRQLTSENAKDSVLTIENKKYLNETLTGFIDEIKRQIKTPNQVPEEISDLEITIHEINNFDPGKVKEKKKESITTSIWNPLDIGHNLFAGNRANSCTALGRNATAIFYLNCDPGSKYIYVENKKGDITGYARVFLALDMEKKPKIYVDSIDGKAHNHKDAVNKKIEELAELIGLSKDDILDRSGSLSSKIGGSLFPEKYFHHSNLKLDTAA